MSDNQALPEMLMGEVRARRREALRPATRRLQNIHWSRYCAFTEECPIPGGPYSADSVCAFLEYLAQQQLTPNTVKSYLSSIRSHFRRSELDVTPLYGIAINDWLRGFEKTFTRHLPELPVITIDQLKTLFALAGRTPEPEFLQALITVAFFSLLRASNLFPPGEFDLARDLQRSHVEFQPGKAIITLPWTKTRQCKTLTKITIVETGTDICPVTALQRFCAAHPCPPHYPLFAMRGRYYTTREARLILHQLHDKANIDKAAAFHAYRRGGARFYFESGMPLPSIKQQGTWRSDAILLYLRDSVPPTRELSAALGSARSEESV